MKTDKSDNKIERPRSISGAPPTDPKEHVANRGEQLRAALRASAGLDLSQPASQKHVEDARRRDTLQSQPKIPVSRPNHQPLPPIRDLPVREEAPLIGFPVPKSEMPPKSAPPSEIAQKSVSRAPQPDIAPRLPVIRDNTKPGKLTVPHNTAIARDTRPLPTLAASPVAPKPGFFNTLAHIISLREMRVRRATQQSQKRLGFSDIRPVRNFEGVEQFGLIELDGAAMAAGGAAYAGNPRYTAALRFAGENIWLSDDRHEVEIIAALGKAMPDVPMQFVLRRRVGNLGQHLRLWQKAVTRRLGDKQSIETFLTDYRDSLVSRLEQRGLADIWCGVFVSGRSEDELMDRLAGLSAALPFESRPCTAQDLAEYLFDYYNPGIASPADESDLGMPSVEDFAPLDMIAPGSLTINGGTVTIGSGARAEGIAYYGVATLPPRIEGGWVRRLLESHALRDAEFDIVAHVTPTQRNDQMRTVLGRRLSTLDGLIEKALNDGHSPRSTYVRDLALERAELEQRVGALERGAERLHEFGLFFALRAPAATLPQDTRLFERELAGQGLIAKMIQQPAKVERAMLTCAPLNRARLPRPFVLPTSEVAPLAFLAATEPQVNPNLPLLGLSRDGTPFHFAPEALGLPGHRIFTGATTYGKSATAKYWALLAYLNGSAVYGIDPQEEWHPVVQQLGGRYAYLAPGSPDHINPLDVSLTPLDKPGGLETWVLEVRRFFSGLYPSLDDADLGNLSALVQELGIALHQKGRTMVNPKELVWRADREGFTKLAATLRTIIEGEHAWIFECPTNISFEGDLLFFGARGLGAATTTTDPVQHLLALALRRLIAHLRDTSGAIAELQRPKIVVVDEAHTALRDPATAESLAFLAKTGTRFNTALWCITQEEDDLLANRYGLSILHNTFTYIFFNHNESGLVALARELNLPQRAVRAISESPRGSAIIKAGDKLFGIDVILSERIARLAKREQAHEFDQPSTKLQTRALPQQASRATDLSTPPDPDELPHADPARSVTFGTKSAAYEPRSGINAIKPPFKRPQG